MVFDSRYDVIKKFNENIRYLNSARIELEEPAEDSEEIDWDYIYYENKKICIHTKYSKSDKEISARNLLKYIKQYFEKYPRVYVNAYAVSRHFGGPEEGGWYYDAGEPLASIPVLNKGSAVEETKKHLLNLFSEDYKRNHNRYSVLGGQDLCILIEDCMAEYWPKQRPHYE